MRPPLWRADRHTDRLPFLRARGRILSAVRGWFATQGFVETDLGALCASPGAELHTEALRTAQGYLHTSPEFAMKQLLAAGEDKIFFLGKVYRAGETGPLHAPEFTMLEWYRAGAAYEDVMADAVSLARIAADSAGADVLSWRGRRCDPFAAPERLTVAAAFARHAQSAPPSDTDAFAARLVSAVEPHLGADRLTLLYDYPLSEAALARRSPRNPECAERFELYACGVELANGFGELTDSAEQRARLEETMAEKRRRYGHDWPLDEDFLEAVARMPECAGCALGFDRLVMLASGARSIDDVLWSAAPP